MDSEFLQKCPVCQGKAKYEVSDSNIIFPKHEHECIIKNVPRMFCENCRLSFKPEPCQDEKTKIFLDFMETLPFSKVELEYKEMIRYVDTVLCTNDINKNSGDDNL
ncbi:MAG: YgiT-type zinc finger protein [Firmicutes bacterium]|nr:YgiT-type zinc finger protein [Bacillota bacterium]